MNRRIRQLAVTVMVLYAVLFGALNYWQVNATEQLEARPTNDRARIREFDRTRGQIFSADGVLLATSVANPDPTADQKTTRSYPTGDLFAKIVGHHTFGLGTTGVEAAQADVLTGATTVQQLQSLESVFDPTTSVAGSVTLTVRADLQQAAKDLLGEREGSVVMIDVQTGAVLSMWSWPSYDPNLVANPDYNAAFEEITRLQEDSRNPLLASAYQDRYMPGSTFKVLTTAAGLETRQINLESYWQPEREYVPPQTKRPVRNYANTICGGDLAEVFRRSCNTPFSRMAIGLGPALFIEHMDRWGVGQKIPFDLPRGARSTVGETNNLGNELPLLAMRGFGQNEVQLVPLHLALMAGAVANEGRMMRPYTIASTRDYNGNILSETTPQRWKVPIASTTAATLTDLMIGVAEDGTARCCIALEGGVPVAAKTGTAQLNERGEAERSHAWITAFAPADQPRYAVAVMLKGVNAEISAGTGGQLAGPIAKGMLDAALAAERPGPDAPQHTAPSPTTPPETTEPARG